MLLAVEGQREEALAAYRRAAAIREAIAGELPQDSDGAARSHVTVLTRHRRLC